MKKLLLVLVLFAVITAGTAFADYPDGLGIGVVYGGAGYWNGGFFGYPALSLKLPNADIFWAIRLGIGHEHFDLTISGDKYFIHNPLVSEIGLHWYIGLGLGLGVHLSDPIGLGVTGRLPIGLSWQPIPLLEVFLQLIPTLGLQLLPNFHFPYGGWGGDIGLRLWL